MNRWRSGSAVARGALALSLLVTSAAKLHSGYSDSFGMPQWLYYTVAVAELFAALGLCSRWWRPVGRVVLVACLLGVLRGLVWPSATACGCAGKVDLAGSYTALVLSGWMGALAVLTRSVHLWQPAVVGDGESEAV